MFNFLRSLNMVLFFYVYILYYNISYNMTQSINLKQMIGQSFLDNKILILSIGALFAGYWFQDIMFSRNFGKVLADIPEFVKSLSFSSVLGILFPYIISNFLFYIDDLIHAKKFPVMEQTIVNNLVDGVFESMKTTKKQVNINELVLNLKNVLDIKNIYLLIVIYIVPTLLVGAAMLYYFMSSDVTYGLIAIVLLTLLIILSSLMEKDCIKISEEHEQSIGKLYDEIQDIMTNNDTILTFDTKNDELKHMGCVGDDCTRKHIKSELKSGEVTFKLNSFSMLIMLCLDGLAIKLYSDGKIGPEMLISICMMAYTFIQYFNSSIMKFKSVMHYIGKYSELTQYFSTFKIKKNKFAHKSINITNGNIEFKNVQVIHDNKPMKKKFNLEIKGGQTTGIIGEIGTGKSSIIKILAGLKNYLGNVYIDGKNINDYSHESLMEHTIYIPQHPKLFNRTIFENLSYGTTKTQKEIEQIIKKYNIEKFFKKFPKGIMSNVGKEGSKLSGGQRQIMALIRAIIQQKQIILLDEPTSSLDVETKKIFTDLIESIKDKTILIVTHDKSIHDLFDELIELD
jgi:ABC-type multidrug transport system fused ATPase/permease subunit